MSVISIFLLALALAADSFAASIAKGAQVYRPTIGHALLVGALFGSAQVLLPLLGWQVGLTVQPVIESIDHWIAFGILTAIGGKMIYEGRKARPQEDRPGSFTLPALVLTAIATSIDSLVVGFGFGFLQISVLMALTMIGSVTFLTSFGGVYLGRRLSHHVGEYAEIAAGIVLIAIGTKILLDHTILAAG